MKFFDYHPFLNMVFFLPVIGFAMFCDHPVFLLSVIFCGMAYDCLLGGVKALGTDLAFYFSSSVIIMLINGLFSHNGATVLFYINGSRITVEAIVYGAVIAGMISGVFIWFKCMWRILTGEKIIFLFGRIAPSFAMLLRLILGFLPGLKKKLLMIRTSRGLMDPNRSKIRGFWSDVSVLLAWSLESSIDKADMMQARGYGNKKRSFYHLYRMRGRDVFVTVLIMAAFGMTLAGCIFGKNRASYFPVILIKAPDPLFYAAVFSYIFLMMIPFVIDTAGELRWKYYALKR